MRATYDEKLVMIMYFSKLCVSGFSPKQFPHCSSIVLDEGGGALASSWGAACEATYIHTCWTTRLYASISFLCIKD